MNFELMETFLMLLVVFLEVLHYKERKDLYNRLMAKNLTEYSSHKVEEAKVKIPAKPERELLHI